jgi:hypothetical protein
MDRRRELLYGVDKVKPTAWATVYNGSASCVRCGSAASVDNLHDAAFTAEAWIYTAHSGSAYVIGKQGPARGWALYKGGAGTVLVARVNCATTNAVATSALVIADSAWHHIAMTWDDAGDRKVYTWLDGVQAAVSGAGVGAVNDDAADDLYLGTWSESGLFWNGRIGWARISNVVRYTETFAVPSRIIPPAVDADTVRLFKMDEGTGTTITDSSANAANGTLVTGSWVKS